MKAMQLELLFIFAHFGKLHLNILEEIALRAAQSFFQGGRSRVIHQLSGSLLSYLSRRAIKETAGQIQETSTTN